MLESGDNCTGFVHLFETDIVGCPDGQMTKNAWKSFDYTIPQNQGERMPRLIIFAQSTMIVCLRKLVGELGELLS